MAREKSVSDGQQLFPFPFIPGLTETTGLDDQSILRGTGSSTCPDGSPPQGGQCSVPIGEGETNCPDGGPPVDGQCPIPAPGPDPAPSPGPGPTPPGFIVIGEPTCEGGEPPNSAGQCETTTTSDPEFCEGGGAPDANGQCPGDPVAPGFCEGGGAPDANGQCPDDPVAPGFCEGGSFTW